MLDMPLEEIQRVLQEDRSLSEAIVNQQEALERKARELQAAIHFCEQMKEVELDTLDVDRCLSDIENDNCEYIEAFEVDIPFDSLDLPNLAPEVLVIIANIFKS